MSVHHSVCSASSYLNPSPMRFGAVFLDLYRIVDLEVQKCEAQMSYSSVPDMGCSCCPLDLPFRKLLDTYQFAAPVGVLHNWLVVRVCLW